MMRIAKGDVNDLYKKIKSKQDESGDKIVVNLSPISR